MDEVRLKEPFFDLPKIDLEDMLDGFILNTELYEKAIAERNGGLSLSSITEEMVSKEDIEHYEKIVPYHQRNSPRRLLDNAIPMAKRHNIPFAKSLRNINELERDILMIYQIAYSHYVLAKHYGFTNGNLKFPFSNCGPSARSTLVTSWIQGFFNGCYASYNNGDGRTHGYNMFPFVMQKPNFKGVILMDPTSSQLGKCEGKVHRNLVLIKHGSSWNYCTDYDDGANLFPVYVMFLGTILKKGAIHYSGNGARLSDRSIDYFYDGKKFLDMAFSNPIELQSPIRG